MSSATLVPETYELTGDDAWETLKRTGWRRLAADAFKRLRVADGFSHARSLAFLITLLAIEGLIGLVGLANVVHKGQISAMIDAAVRRTVPGPVGHVLTTAVSQAHHVAATHHYGALLFGVIGALVVGTTAMGQLERGFNRIYGIEQDRPALEKYGFGFLFAVSVGTLVAASFVCLAFGRELFVTVHNGALSTAWLVLRWPVGVGLTTIAITVLFRWSPRRRQPRFSWLAFGSGISILLWGLSTVGLGLFLGSSSSFGQTYGPLAGVIALLIWSLLSSFSVFYGIAVAAQLESLRSARPAPQDVSKVLDSEPASDSSGGGTIAHVE